MSFLSLPVHICAYPQCISGAGIAHVLLTLFAEFGIANFIKKFLPRNMRNSNALSCLQSPFLASSS